MIGLIGLIWSLEAAGLSRVFELSAKVWCVSTCRFSSDPPPVFCCHLHEGIVFTNRSRLRSVGQI